MPMDPYIARGVAPIDFSNSLLQVATLKQRDQALANDKAQQDAVIQEHQQAQAAAQEKQQLLQQLAKVQWGKKNGRMAVLADPTIHPQAAQAIQSMSDAQFQQMMDAQEAAISTKLGQGPPDQKQPGALYKVRGPNGQAQYVDATKAQGMTPWQEPVQGPQPPQPQLVDVILPDGRIQKQWLRPGQTQGAPVGAPYTKPGGPDKTNPLGLNERQQAGLAMEQSNAISYAANLTRMPRDVVQKLYDSGGPDAVYNLMVKKGKRFLQGGLARAVQGVPFVGNTIVDVTNPDLIAPAKGGGAGIALLQNPSGPITASDFAAGQAQFPGAIYPLETQAEMVRQMLKGGPTQAGAAMSQAPPIEKLKEGVQTTFANGQTWTLQNGQPVQVQ